MKEDDEIRTDGTASDAEKPAENGAEKKKKALRRGFVIGGCVLLVILAVVVGYAIWERPPDIVMPTAPVATTSNPTPATAQPTADPNDPDATPVPTDEVPPPEEEGEAPAVSLTSDRKEGVYTFLLVGIDANSNNTDTIMVVSFDTKNHAISATSIPRDTMINVKWATTPKKINAAYSVSKGGGGNGIDGIKSVVRNLLGFDVDCYVFVNIEAVEHAVDAIGGVWYDVPRDMIYRDPTQDLEINIKAGYQKLNGEDAVKLCRFRRGYSGGDIQRISVQHDFLKALASQLISLGSIPHLGELIDVLMTDVDTDLKAENLAWLARQFLACKTEDIVFQTAPYVDAQNVNGFSYVGLNVPAWLEMINANVNPFVDDVTKENVNILTFRYNGAAIGATSGKVEGGLDSFYCLECTNEFGERISHAPGQHLTQD